MTAWWLRDDCLMNEWMMTFHFYLSYECLMTSDDSWMTQGWLLDDSRMTHRWLLDDSGMTLGLGIYYIVLRSSLFIVFKSAVYMVQAIWYQMFKDDCLMTAWWLPDDCLMTVWWIWHPISILNAVFLLDFCHTIYIWTVSSYLLFYIGIFICFLYGEEKKSSVLWICPNSPWTTFNWCCKVEKRSRNLLSLYICCDYCGATYNIFYQN